jgi:alpha-glucosidase
MMLLTLRGTPTLYYGDELGLPNVAIPAHKIQDPQGVNLGPERTRDVCRTPMQWDYTENAGFSEVEPWLPVSADFASRNVADMLEDPTSILNLYRELLAVRKNTHALQVGGYNAVDILTEDCFIYQRATQNECCLIALNFANKEQTFTLANVGKTTCLLSTHLDRKGEIDLKDIKLRPYEGLIIQL